MTSALPLPSAAARLGVLLHHIGWTLAGRVSWTTLAPFLVGRITKRLREIKLRIERIEALVLAGKYKPRRRSAPAAPGARKPPPRPDPGMRDFGWLEQLLPDVAMPRGDFLSQLRQPEMVALIQAAPVPVIRPLRSICWMLKLKPPPILALPKRPPRPKPPKQPEQPEAAPVAAPAPATEPRSALPDWVAAKWPHASPLLRRAGFPVKLPTPRARGKPNPD